MPVLITFKFDKDWMKTEGFAMETWFSAKFSSLKGM